MASEIYEAKPVPQMSYLIRSGPSDLSGDLFEEYTGLLLKAEAGDRYSLAMAQTIHLDAARDLLAIRSCREQLERLKAAEAPAPKRAIRKLEDLLDEVQSNIRRLEVNRDNLIEQIRQSSDSMPHPPAIRKQLTMTSQNPTARRVLAKELADVGV